MAYQVMKNLGLLNVILLVGFVAAISSRGEASSQDLTLDGALEIAMKGHPRLMALEHEIAAADARVTQAASTRYPRLDAGGLAKQGLSGAASAFGLNGIASSPFPDDLATSGNLSYDFLDFGRTEHRTAARNFELAAITEKARAEKARVILNVTKSFFKALENAKLGYVSKQKVRRDELRLRQLKIFARTGLRSQLDVERAEVNLRRAQADARKTDNHYLTAMAELEDAIGVGSLGTDYSLKEPEIVTESPLKLARLLEDAVQQRPELRALDNRIKATEAWLELAESERKPRFMASFSAGIARFAQLTLSNLLFGGIAFKLPIFEGKQLQAKIDEVSELLEMTKKLQQEMKQKVEMEVKRASGEVQNSIETIEVNRSIVRYARRTFQMARLKYRAELEDLVKLTNIETSLTSSETDLSKSLYDYRTARAELQFAVGGVIR